MELSFSLEVMWHGLAEMRGEGGGVAGLVKCPPCSQSSIVSHMFHLSVTFCALSSCFAAAANNPVWRHCIGVPCVYV